MDKEFSDIRTLFEKSLPELTPDEIFIKRIENRINFISLIAEDKNKYKRKNLITAIISGLSGFLCGVILTLFYPYLSTLINTLLITYLQIEAARELVSITGSCIIIALCCIFTFVATFKVVNQMDYMPIFQLSSLKKPQMLNRNL